MSGGRFLTAYLDRPFLDKLFQSKPDLAASPGDTWPETWQNVYRFLQRSARIVVDASREEIGSESLLTRFFLDTGQWSHVDPRPGVSEQYSDPESVNIDDPYSVFLFENPEIPVDDLRERKGLLFLRHDDLDKYWLRLFSEHAIDVQPKTENPFTWKHLRRHALPLNAIVIADKYAFAHFEESRFEENIGALLCAVLPEELLDQPFHVTIVTDLQAPLDQLGPNEICDFVQSCIKKCRPELEFHLTLIGYRGNGHKDRFIFTNYGFFTSNDSFAFFQNGKLRKETLIQYLPNSTRGPLIAERRLRRIAELCSDPPKAYRHRRNNVLLAAGDNKNRLLDELP